MIKPLCLQTLLSTYSLSLTHTHTETECTKATRWQPEPGKVRQWNMYNFIEKLIGIIIIVFVIRKCRWVKEWRMLHFGCVLNLLGLFEHIQREKFWNTQKKHTHTSRTNEMNTVWTAVKMKTARRLWIKQNRNVKAVIRMGYTNETTHYHSNEMELTRHTHTHTAYFGGSIFRHTICQLISPNELHF